MLAALLLTKTGASTSRAVSSAAAHVIVPPRMEGREVATLAGGCFWCVEGAFTPLRGVDSAVSGYINGAVVNPTYEAVCSGRTGHAEAVQITFDPAVLPLKRVLDIFFTVHDPTQLNRQGNDHGTQYRSGIYFHTDAQRDAANAYIREQQAAYSAPIVTEVVPAQVFYPAEEYHQRYYEKNPNAGYCRAVVRPKVDKVRSKFAELL